MATKFNKLVVFVRISAIDAVKSAVFAAGGRYSGPGNPENYPECAWQTNRFRAIPSRRCGQPEY